MRSKIWTRILSGLLFLIIAACVPIPSTASDGGVVLAQDSNVSEEIAQLIHQIEAPQVPDRQGLDGLTLQEVMQKLHTPGLSIAVIKDFRIQWAKGYGLADIKAGASRGDEYALPGGFYQQTGDRDGRTAPGAGRQVFT